MLCRRVSRTLMVHPASVCTGFLKKILIELIFRCSIYTIASPQWISVIVFYVTLIEINLRGSQIAEILGPEVLVNLRVWTSVVSQRYKVRYFPRFVSMQQTQSNFIVNMFMAKPVQVSCKRLQLPI